MTPATRGILLSLLAFAIFASHDAVIKGLGQTYSVFQIVFFSVLFGFPPVALAMGTSRALNNFVPHHPWWLLARTLLIVVGMGSAFYAFSNLPLAETYAILFAMPLLITILSVPFLGEKVGLRRWIAIVIGLVGVLIVLRPTGTTLEAGHLAALIAAIAAAFGAIIIRKSARMSVLPSWCSIQCSPIFWSWPVSCHRSMCQCRSRILAKRRLWASSPSQARW